jgi:uncharacterized coiled-coil protein SlyX
MKIVVKDYIAAQFFSSIEGGKPVHQALTEFVGAVFDDNEIEESIESLKEVIAGKDEEIAELSKFKGTFVFQSERIGELERLLAEEETANSPCIKRMEESIIDLHKELTRTQAQLDHMKRLATSMAAACAENVKLASGFYIYPDGPGLL